jgi:hypothetical protein
MISASIPVPAVSRSAVDRAEGNGNLAALGGKFWTRQYVLAYHN